MKRAPRRNRIDAGGEDTPAGRIAHRIARCARS
nr:MAG TPA: hypothetical protein [Caudoviricetes sp.]